MKDNKKKTKGVSALSNKQLSNNLKNLLYSFLLWIVLVVLIRTDFSRAYTDSFFIRFTHSSVAFFCKILGIPVVDTSCPTISIYHTAMEIVPECTIYDYYLMVIALVAFTAWKWKDRLINGLIMLTILYFTNILRFLMMGFVGRFLPSAFKFTHDYLWGLIFALFTLALWIWLDNRASNVVSQPVKNDTKKPAN